MDDLLRLLLLKDPNTRLVLLGSGVLGAASGIIGTFAVLRRRSLVGDALSHASLPGICAAYLVVGDRNLLAFLLGALVFGVLGVVCISAIQAFSRIKEDAAIGIVLSSFFGLGLVLSSVIQKTPGGNKAGLDGFLFGKAASMVRSDVMLIMAACALIIVFSGVLFKEFGLLCFDRGFAAAIGRPVVAMDLLMMSLVCVCVVAGLPAVGAVLTAALLIIPAAAARFWTDHLPRVVLLSMVFGVAAALGGSALSATLPVPSSGLSRGWPTGPMIVLSAVIVFLVSMLVAPRRGVIAEAVRRTRLRRRIALQNLLRGVYELGERRGKADGDWDAAEIVCDGMNTRGTIGRAIRAARGKGFVRSAAGGRGASRQRFTLTGSGLVEAAQMARTHRLWELFLIHHADIAPDHVHRDADELEHLLPPSILAELQERMEEEGRLASAEKRGVPASPHAASLAVGGGA